MGFSVETDRQILKFLWKQKGLRTNNLEREQSRTFISWFQHVLKSHGNKHSVVVESGLVTWNSEQRWALWLAVSDFLLVPIPSTSHETIMFPSLLHYNPELTPWTTCLREEPYIWLLTYLTRGRILKAASNIQSVRLSFCQEPQWLRKNGHDKG